MPPPRKQPPRACRRPRAAVSTVTANRKPLEKLRKVFRSVVTGSAATPAIFRCAVYVHSDGQCADLLGDAMICITRELLKQQSITLGLHSHPPAHMYTFAFIVIPYNTTFVMSLQVFPEDGDDEARIVLCSQSHTVHQ
jgi:hypothetical protein